MWSLVNCICHKIRNSRKETCDIETREPESLEYVNTPSCFQKKAVVQDQLTVESTVSWSWTTALFWKQDGVLTYSSDSGSLSKPKKRNLLKEKRNTRERTERERENKRNLLLLPRKKNENVEVYRIKDPHVSRVLFDRSHASHTLTQAHTHKRDVATSHNVEQTRRNLQKILVFSLLLRP